MPSLWREAYGASNDLWEGAAWWGIQYDNNVIEIQSDSNTPTEIINHKILFQDSAEKIVLCSTSVVGEIIQIPIEIYNKYLEKTEA